MTAPSIERARLHVACGPLATALAPRFVRAIAAHTTLGVDRVEHAVRITLALSEHCHDLLDDAPLEIAARVLDGGLELYAGPFEAGIPRRVLEADVIGDGTIGRLGDAAVRTGRDGRERLRVLVA